jgi:hypothetical protein
MKTAAASINVSFKRGEAESGNLAPHASPDRHVATLLAMTVVALGGPL